MIKKILIQNFRNITLKEWEPSKKMSIIMKDNAQGKTSFLKALNFALSGEIDKADIMDGVDSTYVEVTFTNGNSFSREVSRTKPTKIKFNGKSCTAKALQENLESAFNVDFEDFKVITSGNMAHLDSTELSALLMKHIPEKLDADKVKAYATGLKKEEADLLLSFFPAMPNKFELEELDVAYAKACEERKVRKKLKEAAEVRAKYDGPVPTRNLKAVEDEYSALLTKEAKQKAEKDNINLYNSSVTKKNELVLKIKEAEEKLKDYSSVMKPNTVVLENIEKDITALQKEKISNESVINSLLNSNKMFSEQLNNLNTEKCPLCDSIKCTTDKSCAKKDIEAVIAENEKNINSLKTKNENIDKALTEKDTKKGEFKALEKKYNEKITLMNNLNTMKTSLSAIPTISKPNSLTMVDYSVEKAKLIKEKEAVQLYALSQKAVKELDDINASIEVIERVVSLLSPKGDIRVAINNYYVSFFNVEINKVAKKLNPNFEFSFIAQNGITVTFKTFGNEFHKYESLSESEKVMANFCLMAFLNEFMIFHLLIMDDLNHLDAKNFEAIMSLVMSKEIQDKYNNIIFASVINKDFEDVVKKYDVEEI